MSQRPHDLRPWFLLASLGAGLLAAPASYAQSTRSSGTTGSTTGGSTSGGSTSGGSTSSNFFQCQMTAASCLHPRGLCEYAAAQKMHTDDDALCHHLINDAAIDAVNDHETYATLDNSGAHVEAWRQVSDPAGNFFSGHDSEYLGRVLAASVAFNNPEPWDAAELYFDRRTNEYAVNGDAISKCEEYAYEKYFDYSEFEDVSLPYYQSSNFAAIADLAFADNPTDQGAIGRRAIYNGGLQQKNRKPMPDVAFSGGARKNAFFDLPLSAESPLSVHAEPVDVAAGEPPIDVDLAYGPGGVVVKLAHQHRELYLDGVVFTNHLSSGPGPKLEDIWLGGQHTYAAFGEKGFQWHGYMHSLPSTATAYERGQWLQARDDFEQLMRDRRHVVTAIRALLPVRTPDVQLFEPASAFDALGPVYNPEYGLSDIYEAEYVDALADPESDLEVGMFQNELQAYVINGGWADQPPGPPVVPTYLETLAPLGPQTKLIALFYQLQDIDDRLEAAFKNAPAECITGVGCDWHPRDFAVAMSNHFVTERERAYKTCMDFTGGALGEQEFQPLYPFPGCDQEDFPKDSRWKMWNAGKDYTVQCTTDTDHLDYCMQCFSHQLAGVKAFAGQLVDPQTHQVRLLKSDGDSATQGNKWFGATVSYQSGFMASDVDQLQPTQVTMLATSALAVDATVLTVPISIFNASIGVSDAPVPLDEDHDAAWASIYILGNEYAPETLELGPVNVIGGVASLMQTFAHEKGEVWFGPIRVVVDASITGEVGATYAGSGGKTENGASRVEAHLTPYASLDAWASAAVDYYAASAGIRGHLTVARVSVPLTVKAALDQAKKAGELDLSLLLQADVVFEIMSGSLSAYVEVDYLVGDWEAETELLSWDGMRRTMPLMKMNVEQVPLQLLREVALQQKLLAGVP